MEWWDTHCKISKWEDTFKTVILTDGTTHRREKVLMVPHNTVIAPTTWNNVIKVATKKHKDRLYFKCEGIDDAKVIEGKRNRTKK